MKDGVIDKQTAAAFVKHLREDGDVGAVKVAIMNIVWSLYTNDIDLPEVTEEEADEILEELPTSYDREQE